MRRCPPTLRDSSSNCRMQDQNVLFPSPLRNISQRLCVRSLRDDSLNVSVSVALQGSSAEVPAFPSPRRGAAHSSEHFARPAGEQPRSSSVSVAPQGSSAEVPAFRQPRRGAAHSSEHFGRPKVADALTVIDSVTPHLKTNDLFTIHDSRFTIISPFSQTLPSPHTASGPAAHTNSPYAHSSPPPAARTRGCRSPGTAPCPSATDE
jgi:hypothetical protein